MGYQKNGNWVGWGGGGWGLDNLYRKGRYHLQKGWKHTGDPRNSATTAYGGMKTLQLKEGICLRNANSLEKEANNTYERRGTPGVRVYGRPHGMQGK